MPGTTETTVPCIASAGKDTDSKFKVRILLNAYHFRTIIKSSVCGTIIESSVYGTILSQGPSVFNTVLNRAFVSILCCIYKSIKFVLKCGGLPVVGRLFECPVEGEGRALFNHAGYLEKAFQ